MRPVSQDFWYRVVAEWVWNQFDDVALNSTHQSGLLRFLCSLLNKNLDDTEAIPVNTQIVHIFVNFIKDEGTVLKFQNLTLQNFLHDMGALLVHREETNLTSEYLLYVLLFIWEAHSVKDSLDCVGTSLVAADLCEVSSYKLKDPWPLSHTAHWKQLLTEVVAIAVDHNSGQIFINVLQKKLNDWSVSLSKLFLKIAGT